MDIGQAAQQLSTLSHAYPRVRCFILEGYNLVYKEIKWEVTFLSEGTVLLLGKEDVFLLTYEKLTEV